MTTQPGDQPRRSFIRRHPLWSGVLLLVGLLLVLIIAAVWVAASWDYRPILEKQATALAGRPVKIGSLEIHWGNPLASDPLGFNIRDIHLANAAWGSTPDMATVKGVTAEIDIRALMHGQVRFQKLAIDGPVIVLERNPNGVGNWQFGKTADAAPAQKPAGPQTDVTPKGRRDFPVLLDFILRDGKITYRTFSGHVLKIDLHQVTIRTTGDDQPVEIAATGAYNDAELALAVHAHSFDELHQANKPFGAAITLTRKTAQLNFDGTLTDPLNVDGADGTLNIKTDKLSDILSVFHADLSADPAASLKGHLTRQGDLWHLTKASGQLARNPFTGEMTLTEGSRGESDDIKLETNFDQLDLNTLLPKTEKKSGGKDDWRSLSLETPDKTAPRIAAKLSAALLVYQDKSVKDIRLDGKIAPGLISLDSADLTYGGIPLHLAASLQPAATGSRLHAALGLKEADFQTLAKLLGSATTDLAGKINGGIDLTLQGKTLGDGIKTSSGGAVLSLINGQVSRDLLEKASTDVRNVFRNGEGTARVTCLLAVMHLQNGIGTLAPVRLRSSAATLNGQGRVDFLHQTLDLTLQSDRKSTDFFALDLPIHLSGAWDQPKVDLLKKSNGNPAVSGKLGDLPPALQGIAEANSCRQ